VGANRLAADGIIVTKTLNAASAKVYGLEGDLTYVREPRRADAALAANWNHARYGTSRIAVAGRPAGTGRLATSTSPSAAAQQTVAGPRARVCTCSYF